jgi:hypothetical protein
MADGSTIEAFEHGLSLSIVGLRGSVPQQWILDFRTCLGQYAGFSFDQRSQLLDIFQDLGEPERKRSAALADVATLGDAWLGPAIKGGLVQPLESADTYRCAGACTAGAAQPARAASPRLAPRHIACDVGSGSGSSSSSSSSSSRARGGLARFRACRARHATEAPAPAAQVVAAAVAALAHAGAPRAHRAGGPARAGVRRAVPLGLLAGGVPPGPPAALGRAARPGLARPAAAPAQGQGGLH